MAGNQMRFFERIDDSQAMVRSTGKLQDIN